MCHGTAQLQTAFRQVLLPCLELAQGSSKSTDDHVLAAKPSVCMHTQEGGDASAYVSEPLVAADMDLPAAGKRVCFTPR